MAQIVDSLAWDGEEHFRYGNQLSLRIERIICNFYQQLNQDISNFQVCLIQKRAIFSICK